MRLLTVTHFYEQHGGGIERVAAHLCRQFALEGHDAAWAASDSDPTPAPPVRPLGLRCVDPLERLTGLPMPIPLPRALAALDRAVRHSDAVIVHDALYLTSIAAMMIAKIRRKPVVLIQHIESIQFASPLMRAVMRLCNRIITVPMLKAADRRVFISNKVRTAFRRHLGEMGSQLLFNGVDPAVFRRPASADPADVRRVHGLPATSPFAIFVGRFVEKKGLAVLHALAMQRPDLTIAMVGTGPIHADAWNLPNVHVLGPQDQPTIADLFGAAEMLLLPSVGEGFPLVVQEAMACGLPVVCGTDSALADPQAAGWLHGVEIDLGDPEGSARRCGDAVDQTRRAPATPDAMAAHARHSYSWPAMAKAIVDSI